MKFIIAIEAELYDWLRDAAVIARCEPEDVIYLAMKDFRTSPARRDFCRLVDEIRCDLRQQTFPGYDFVRKKGENP